MGAIAEWHFIGFHAPAQFDPFTWLNMNGSAQMTCAVFIGYGGHCFLLEQPCIEIIKVNLSATIVPATIGSGPGFPGGFL
jgi:hypothetical protein